MKNNIILVFVCITALFCFSCGNYNKVPYFQDLNRDAALQQEIKNYSPFIIQTGDILAISVTSLSPEASAVFNYNLNKINGVNADNTPTNAVVGYLVDQQGNIQLPQLGTVKAAGLTTADLRDQLTKNLVTLLKQPLVNIRILNFKISVMGDVARPNVYTIDNERITIPEALSLAGDLNITAKRDILLIREEGGKREFIPIDLTSKKLFDSPYYYLKNNDVIYVDPDRTKYETVDNSYRNAELALSVISALSLIATLILYRR